MDSPGFQRRHRLPRGLESLALRGPLRRLHRFGHRQLPRLRHRSRRGKHGHKSLDRSRTSVVMIGLLMFVARLGLRVGKWVTNAGSFLTVLIITLLALMPFIHRWRGSLSGYHALHLVTPPLTLFSLSVFSKMTFGALCGFEYAAIFAGESRNPARHLKRAILITAPLIALLYIFGTSAILAYVSPDSIDVISPIPQALSRGFTGHGFARIIVPVAILLLFTNYLSTFSLNFTANSRLPMVAGWDHLLPEWFTRLHAKYKTPVNSIFFLGESPSRPVSSFSLASVIRKLSNSSK